MCAIAGTAARNTIGNVGLGCSVTAKELQKVEAGLLCCYGSPVGVEAIDYRDRQFMGRLSVDDSLRGSLERLTSSSMERLLRGNAAERIELDSFISRSVYQQLRIMIWIATFRVLSDILKIRVGYEGQFVIVADDVRGAGKSLAFPYCWSV